MKLYISIQWLDSYWPSALLFFRNSTQKSWIQIMWLIAFIFSLYKDFQLLSAEISRKQFRKHTVDKHKS